MQKIKAIIFDMDGTLYTFDKDRTQVFTASKFGGQIRSNGINFFKQTLNLNDDEALARYQDLKNRFNGEISLGVEKELGIDRSIYFAQTWDLNPGEFMDIDESLVSELSLLTVKTGILSAAPKIWVDRVLKFLGINQFFEPAIFTGDPDLRKPNPLAFKQLADFWNIPTSSILAIGDQEESDILPAKSLGMLTAKVGEQAQTSADFFAPSLIELLIKLRKENLYE